MTEPLRDNDPRHVGGYRLEARLGSGETRQVYLAFDDESGRQVAVTVLRPDPAASGEFRARFARDLAAARTVSGAHTVTVIDADPRADPPWLTCEYIPGPSLLRVVTERGPLPPGELRKLGRGLANGLADIHRCGLVHRNLKPGNVIMSAFGSRIIDLGIVRTLDADAATPASDVFALGGVLVFAATGEGPFAATGQPPGLDGVPDGLRQLIADCLSANPSRRPGLDDVLSELARDSPTGLAMTEADTEPPSETGAAQAVTEAAAIGVPAGALWPHSGEPAKKDASG